MSGEDIRQGDIYWVAHPSRTPHGSEISKTRPAIILSRTKTNAIRKTVIVVPLTHGQKESPPIVILVASAGPDSRAVCDQVSAVDKARLGNKIGSLTSHELSYLKQCLRKLMDL
jgi:mRNA-degrading endonuclease toxin of MazEF toxin-antitoxin module